MPKLNQDAKKQHKHIHSEKWDWQNNSLPTEKTAGSDGVTDEFYQTFTELTLMFLNLLYKIKEILPNSFYIVNIVLTSKLYSSTATTKKEYWRPIWWTCMQKTSIKYFQTKFNNTFKWLYNIIKLVSFQGCKNVSTYANQET
jgi:hypothetical protein